MPAALFLAAALLSQNPDEGPIVTAAPTPVETPDQVRRREAIAYSFPLPEGAPAEDFAFVGWCIGLVGGHIQLGETLPGSADAELMRLARLELNDFETAFSIAAERKGQEETAEAVAAREASAARWDRAIASDDAGLRLRAFDLAPGLPGRCEHAARRLRDDITEAPATLEQVGLSEEQVLPPELRTPAAEPTDQPDAETEAEPAETTPTATVRAPEPETPALTLTERLNRGG